MHRPPTRHPEPDPELPPYAEQPPVVKPVEMPREVLDDQAVFVVKRLQQNGHEAYLVGGCVRDLLAGLEPKDFDVATDAYPNRIKRLFRSARVIGRRFRLVHVRFPGDHVIETATFRGDPAYRSLPEANGEEDQASTGRRRRNWRESVENIFGTAPEDAHRRDFTINALFYDPIRHAVIDYVGGLEDMDAGVIRAIGDPTVRIEEDPVRMLRAVHFARRMDYQLEPALEGAIRDNASALEHASQARLYIELVKILSRGRGHATMRTLYDLGVLHVWLPELTEALDTPATWPTESGGTHEEASRGEPEDLHVAHATWNLLGAADQYGMAAHNASESLALAVLFGPWILTTWDPAVHIGFHGFLEHVESTFRPVALRMSIPKHATARMRDMLWLLRLLRHPPARPKQRRRMLFRPAFADALRLYELDLMARDADSAPVEAWQAEAQEAGANLDPARRGDRRERGPRGGQARQGGGRRRGRRRGRRGGRGGRGRGRGGEPRRPKLSEEAGAWLPPPPPEDA